MTEWRFGDKNPLLTDDERRCIAQLGHMFNLLSRIVGNGLSRDGDMSELAAHIHALQNCVLAQAAARQWPHQYRLLGETVAGRPAQSETER